LTMVTQPLSFRGRLISRPTDPSNDQPPRTVIKQQAEITPQKADFIRRSQSGPPSRKLANRFSWPSTTYPAPVLFQPSPSIRSHHLHVQIPPAPADTSTVFYETTATPSRIPQPYSNTQQHAVNVTPNQYSTLGSQLSSMSSYHDRINELGENLPPSLEHDLSAIHLCDRGFSGDEKPSITKPTGSPLLAYAHGSFAHRHVPSVVTTASHPNDISRSNSRSPSSSPTLGQLAQRHLTVTNGRMKSRSPSQSPLRTNVLQIPGGVEMNVNLASYPYPAAYVKCPSTPSSSSMSPSSPTIHEEFLCRSSLQPSTHIPVKLGSRSGLKVSMNLGQPHTIPSAQGSVNLAGSPRSVTPLR